MFRFAKRLLIGVTALFAVGCSDNSESDGTGSNNCGVAGALQDDALIVPGGLGVTALEGGDGGLQVLALTLRRGPTNLELYAALKNVSKIWACSTAFSVNLYDRSEQFLETGITGLLTQKFYRLTDGSGTIAACLGPGEVSMGAITDFPPEIAPEDVGYVVYRSPNFALDVVPIDGITITQVNAVQRSIGTVYTGTFINGFDVIVMNPSVTIFSVTRVGRPVGVAFSKAMIEVPPAGSWDFETNAVSEPGADCAAYPAGGLGD